MAKRKTLVQWNGQQVSKSDAIREILKENGKSPVRDVVSRLEEGGIKVNPNLVYLVKSKLRGQRRKQQRARVMETTNRAGVTNPVQLVIRVKDVAREAGGIKALKELVDVLAT